MCAKLRTVAASNNRVLFFHVMPWSLYYCLFVPHICMVLFFTHSPFMMNHTFNATPPVRLQHYCIAQSPTKKICFYYRILLLALHIALICSTTFDQVQWHNQRFEPGGNLAEESEMANTQKIVEKQEQIRYWTTIRKIEITGKHSEKRKKINLLKSNE